MRRIHELVLNDGDAQSYDRLGITYTEGSICAYLLYPDSQHGERSTEITRGQVRSFKAFLEDIEQHLDDAMPPPEEAKT